MKISASYVCRFLLLIIITLQYQGRVLNSQRGRINLKIFHPSQSRQLRQVQVSKELMSNDYSFDQADLDMKISKKQFLSQVKLANNQIFKLPTVKKRITNRLLSEEDEPLPDINVDFETKMKEGVESACSDVTCDIGANKNGVVTIDLAGKPFVDIKLKVEKSTGEDHHNVVISIDNYEYSGEFDKKKMQGLAIIESQKDHREEIFSWVSRVISEFLVKEEDEDSDTEGGLKTVGEGLEKILGDAGADMKQILADEEKGYMFEKRSDDQKLLAIAMVYTISEKVYQIKMKTRAMDEFEMQVREYLRTEDEEALKVQVEEILKAESLVNAPDITEIGEFMNGLLSGAKGNATIAKDCPDEVAFSMDHLDVIPGSIVMEVEAAGGADDMMDMMDMGGGEEEDDGPKEEPVCIFNQSFITMIEIMEMPYLFFTFSNNKMLVEHFIPAINKADAESGLKEAFDSILQINTQVLTAINDNKDPEGYPKKDAKEFVPEDLKNMIKDTAKNLGLTAKDESDNLIVKDGDHVRIAMTAEGMGYRVMFYFPHKLYKDKAETKPLTNEFIFDGSIAYDAISVFQKTLQQFEDAIKG